MFEECTLSPEGVLLRRLHVDHLFTGRNGQKQSIRNQVKYEGSLLASRHAWVTLSRERVRSIPVGALVPLRKLAEVPCIISGNASYVSYSLQFFKPSFGDQRRQS